MHYLLTQRVVMLRVGVTIKQIENKYLQNLLIFRAWTIWGGQKKFGGHCPESPPWLRACTTPSTQSRRHRVFFGVL